MDINFNIAQNINNEQHLIVALDQPDSARQYCKTDEEAAYVTRAVKEEKKEIVVLNQYSRFLLFVSPVEKSGYQEKEAYRMRGFMLANTVMSEKLEKIQLTGKISNDLLLSLCEGFLLSQYQFLKYKKEAENPYRFRELTVVHTSLKEQDLTEIYKVVGATCLARDLVNEPSVSLTATILSKMIREIGETAGFKVEVLEKDKIKSLRMGGLLAVNIGSTEPPTFNVLEYQPENAINTRPLILVGKGVTYDTGGLSLKPTSSMDTMKCDMAGAAVVVGTLTAIAYNKLPIHVVGLIPATDNRPGGNAFVPGDVITISDGTTVEVLNTDAEGRLILADALTYAKKYNPELVIDLATLTGAAAVALGKEGMVVMGNAGEDEMSALKNAGNEVYERLVEFPLWEEYDNYLKSDIADLKNIGGREAGAITAGMFLQHFTDYPWIHLDIAGPAFVKEPFGYRGKNGTGIGVRMLYEFLKKRTQKHG
jgi:leucyl aminopeptidase